MAKSCSYNVGEVLIKTNQQSSFRNTKKILQVSVIKHVLTGHCKNGPMSFPT